MNTTRRGIFGLMAGAPLAAKAAAAEFVVPQGEIAARKITNIGYATGVPSLASVDDTSSAITRIRDALVELVSPENMERMRHDCRPLHIDPDIHANQSWSEQARYNAQWDRNFERRMKNERGWYIGRLRELGVTE